jgi:hypothetical protein
LPYRREDFKTEIDPEIVKILSLKLLRKKNVPHFHRNSTHSSKFVNIMYQGQRSELCCATAYAENNVFIPLPSLGKASKSQSHFGRLKLGRSRWP